MTLSNKSKDQSKHSQSRTLEERWVDTHGAAEITGYAAPTLESLRSRGGGCRYSKIGRSVRYRVSDLIAWMESRVVDSTSQA